jgi:hypothetical protein
VRFFLFCTLLAAHLLAVNVASGAPFWTVLCAVGYGRNRRLAQRSGLYLSVAGFGALLVGLLLGLALFGIRWTSASNFDDAATRLQYKLVWGGAELAFSALLSGMSIWLWYERSDAGPASKAKNWIRGGIGLVNATNLLYHFPPLFLILRRVASEVAAGGSESTAIRGIEFLRRMGESPVPAMSVHVALASLAMGGIALMGLSLRLRREDFSKEGDSLADRAGVWAGRAALVPTLLQIPVGLWLLNDVGASVQSKLIGGSLAASLLFLLAIVAALLLLHNLATVSAGQTDRRTLMISMGLSTLTVFLMTFAWHLAGG